MLRPVCMLIQLTSVGGGEVAIGAAVDPIPGVGDGDVLPEGGQRKGFTALLTLHLSLSLLLLLLVVVQRVVDSIQHPLGASSMLGVGCRSSG